MRKILLTAVLAGGAALALLVAACKAPDGADATRKGTAATTTTTATTTNTAATPAAPAQAPKPPADIVRRVTPAELKGMMERGEAVAVDVRAKEEYDKSHIAGAISLPVGEAASRADELPKDKLVVFYCA